MRLSVDRINAKSPYWVLQLDDMQFRFRTKNGVLYRIGFYPDRYFMPNHAYHFYIANDNHPRPPRDVDVFKVVSAVLEEFFRQDASVMLYICDPRDHRERVRASLYKRWFDSYEKKDEMTLRDTELDFSGNIVYSGMILRNDHPQYSQITQAFDKFVEIAPKMYHVPAK